MMVEGISPFKSASLASIAVSRMQSQVAQPMSAHEATHTVQMGSGSMYNAAVKVKVMSKVVSAFTAVMSHNTMAPPVSSGSDGGGNEGISGSQFDGGSRNFQVSAKVLTRSNSATKMLSPTMAPSGAPSPSLQPSAPRTFMFS